MSVVNSVASNAAMQSAYQASKDLKNQGSIAQGTSGTTFDDFVRQASSETFDTVRHAERDMTAGLKGQLSTQAVVEATLEMETTVRVAVSVRDKVVQAYQEVLRMPI